MSDVNWRLLNRRRDHTFAPPVPEMTAAFGAPNPCTTCHDDRSPEWAASMMDRWYGDGARRRAVVATANVMYAAGRGDVEAVRDLAAIASNHDAGAVRQASAAEFIARLAERQSVQGEAMRPVTWVTIDEVASGDWGIAGTALHTSDLVGMRSAAQ